MHKVLIANRGEIAVRVIRACAEAGIASVAVYADQDAEAMHVRMADEAYALGGSTAATSYLSIDAILAAAKTSGADAVHPGYGFLSESAEFARAVEDAGIIWIGPTPESISQLGDKVTARQIAQRVGAPLAAGVDHPLTGPDEAVSFAREHGLPIAIKAAYGGGGRGIKVVRELDEVAQAYETAVREATVAFGRGECFVERYLDSARHIEAQVLGDGRGGVIVVGDRDCSLQRRNQKLVEEAPAPGLTAEQRERVHTAALDICAAVDYRGAGTVEFLLAADGTISFLEVNTRLQVEHPVTELVTDTDLVAEQLRIADGDGPSFTETPVPRGHAIEIRVNAEDPGRGFLPAPGRIDGLRVPAGPGIRWDAGVQAGDTVQPAFDSLMAKLIVHAPDRDAALVRASRALGELEVTGPATTASFAASLLSDEAFSTDAFAVSTRWIEKVAMPRLEAQPRPEAVAPAGLHRFPAEIDGRLITVGLPESLISGLAGASAVPAEGTPDADTVLPTAPGALVDWLVEDGATVAEGDDIAVIDAMKMETRITAPRAGVLRHVAAVGDILSPTTPLARIRAE